MDQIFLEYLRDKKHRKNIENPSPELIILLGTKKSRKTMIKNIRTTAKMIRKF
jgi:hypothetical protein